MRWWRRAKKARKDLTRNDVTWEMVLKFGVGSLQVAEALRREAENEWRREREQEATTNEHRHA